MKKGFPAILALLLSMQIFSQTKSEVEPAFSFLKDYPNVRDFTISASGDEAYFTVQSPLEELGAIACIRKKTGQWLEPELVNFTGKWRDIEPFLSSNGLRLYFSSNRPRKDTAKEVADYDIWYVERKTINGKWSAPVNLGRPVNSDHDEFYPSLALNGNLYFTSERSDSKGKDDIYLSEWKEGKYAEPHSMDTTINSDSYDFNSFVSPDESFLLYTGYNRKGGLGSGDLYISFHDASGQWLPAVSLGEKVNSKQMDYCPYVDIKTGTLYFTSRRSVLPEKTFASLKEFKIAVSGFENGFSRIYKTSIAEVLKRAKSGH